VSRIHTQKGALRYTDKATGRPVIDFPKEMIGAAYGRTESKTARRARSRWNQGAMNAGKGDMPRPRTAEGKQRADVAWLTAFCARYQSGSDCTCFECRKDG
jgi:hypothetical protein